MCRRFETFWDHGVVLMVNSGMAYTSGQMAKYISTYRRDRKEWARARLGGRCTKCGTENDLEFDHIDPEAKIKSIASSLTDSWEKFVTEVEKCQLLCQSCHREKTASQLMSRSAAHGFETMYRRGCRCEECVTKQKERRRKYRKRECVGGPTTAL